MVEQAREDVANRRVQLQGEYNERKAYYEGVISSTEGILAEEYARLAVVNDNIDRLHGEITTLDIQIENLVQELANLDAHEINVNNARNIDIQTYETRRQRD